MIWFIISVIIIIILTGISLTIIMKRLPWTKITRSRALSIWRIISYFMMRLIRFILGKFGIHGIVRIGVLSLGLWIWITRLILLIWLKRSLVLGSACRYCFHRLYGLGFACGNASRAIKKPIQWKRKREALYSSSSVWIPGDFCWDFLAFIARQVLGSNRDFHRRGFLWALTFSYMLYRVLHDAAICNRCFCWDNPYRCISG